MYSSQIVSSTGNNFKKGGLESLGKFVVTSNEVDTRDNFEKKNNL
jgi:hypothetical protein